MSLYNGTAHKPKALIYNGILNMAYSRVFFDPPPLIGPRCRLFNIGPKADPPPLVETYNTCKLIGSLPFKNTKFSLEPAECYILGESCCYSVSIYLAEADLGGGEGAAAPLSSGNHSEKSKFCCAQTVKSNILLSQNAISETLDVHNFSGGCPRTPLAGPPYGVDRPPFSKILDPPLLGQRHKGNYNMVDDKRNCLPESNPVPILPEELTLYFGGDPNRFFSQIKLL